MKKLKKHKINLFAVIITIVGILILTSISCKSPTTPEATEASITITNNCGIAVDINDMEATCVEVKNLLANVERMDMMAINGRKAVEKRYNWSREEAKLLNIYIKL